MTLISEWQRFLLAEAKHEAPPSRTFCFRARLWTQPLGGTICADPYRELGWHEAALTDEGRRSFLFRNIHERLNTFHWYSDHFSLPADYTCPASSRSTSNRAFILEAKTVVGLQLRPEYTRAMVRCFARKCGLELNLGPFMVDPEAMLNETETMPNTCRMMAAMLDNMVCEFSGTAVDG